MKSLVPVIALGVFLLVLVLTARCSQRKMYEYEMREAAAGEFQANTSANDLAERRMLEERFPDTIFELNGLRHRTIEAGEGPKPIAGSRVRVHYEGLLLDGTVFDSSHDRGQPFEFTLLAGEVIQGWDEMVIDMRAGEKRFVAIPSKLAYGERGRPPVIPPRAPLIFVIELIAFEPAHSGATG